MSTGPTDVELDDTAPVALITGVGGQDGTYLAELLVSKGWQVHGIARPDDDGPPFLQYLDGVTVRYQDIADPIATTTAVQEIAPDYVFHLAGISSVWKSWQDPVTTTRVNGVSAAALLDACLQQQEKSGKKVMVVNASSAEIFAGSTESPQTEDTPIRPTSPYGASKAFSHNLVQVYRARGLEGTNAILYNHESPRRPTTFVTRKITAAVAAIAAGKQDTLTLGDTSIRRDWGWAPDYVDAMYRMAMHGKGDDFIVATGEARSIMDFVAAAFGAVGISDWQDLVKSDATLTRPADSAVSIGSPLKARNELNWSVTTDFDAIVESMVQHDRALDGEPTQ
ncbi:GDP-mannose 4,6-dehydratase [Rhodococcus sp. BP-316]|uniref:GDP-mannose 4,6-dehydratase n=1 Tax=Rhodococcus sp. BP-316 TaxID=2739445 RepID=UPI001C9B94C8|nr:GDP-mannose 4,6-dehydratase [Rhodococcus sp. BP-316]MBY6681895.1 GDP-mannose 4,6-dehydratase [Rhodococcus sp. BP-316]